MRKIWLDSHIFVFLFIRLSAVYFVQTWFVPDEYWQSVEVSHNISFGYGYLTWEWLEGIRSFCFPLVFAGVYKILAFYHLDCVQALIYVPRIMQALFGVWSELIYIKGLQKSLSLQQVSWFISLQLGSYFVYYTGSRTLANTLETNFIMMGIGYFLVKNRGGFLLCVMLSSYMRPTSAPLWIPFILDFYEKDKHWIFSRFGSKAILKCFLALGGIFYLDSYWYGKLTIVPLKFLLFNFVNNFSEFYGTHPWHWYFTNALPSLMGPTLFPLLSSFQFWKTAVQEKRKMVTIFLHSAGLYIFFHSLVGHKEIRFLAPAIPLLNTLAASILPNWRWKKVFWFIFLACNIPITWYLSMRHQRGVLDATNFIASSIDAGDKVLYLMPCHSTPLYSHLHVNATLRFLTCPPNLTGEENYIDEADKFYFNPSDWLLENPNWSTSNYLVIFDSLLKSISKHLAEKDYDLVGNFFHADVVQGRVSQFVLVFQRNLKNI